LATFTKLKEMDDDQIQNWLRKVGQENAPKLGIAMLGTEEDVRNLIYKNMSQQAVSHLKDDLEKNKRASFDNKTITSHAAELEKLI
jgi:flagellar motor switch protein FliG